MTEIVQFSIAVLAKFDYITDMKEEEVEKELIEQESDAKSKEDKLPLGTHNLYDYGCICIQNTSLQRINQKAITLVNH